MGKIDPAKPLAMQVGSLGSSYKEWTHHPLPGEPRLFGPDWMEACSKMPWWGIPLVWLPLAAGSATIAHLVYSKTFPALLWRTPVGVAVWCLIEYLLHRFLFHMEASSWLGITFHFLFHGVHHKYPNDALRLVCPLVPAAVMMTFLVSVLRTVLPWSEVFSLAPGIMLGYVMYECTHYWIHHGIGKDNLWLKPLRDAHLAHHFQDFSKGYGVTTPFFDHVCRSLNSQQHVVG